MDFFHLILMFFHTLFLVAFADNQRCLICVFKVSITTSAEKFWNVHICNDLIDNAKTFLFPSPTLKVSDSYGIIDIMNYSHISIQVNEIKTSIWNLKMN